MKGVYSQETPAKQRDFESILQHHLTVCQHIINSGKGHPIYRYIDTFGGPGRYGGIEGSPLIFQRLIQRFDIDYRGDIFEIDWPRCINLMGLVTDPKIKVHQGSNLSLLSKLTLDHQNQHGLLYCDPPQDESTLENSFAMMQIMASRYSRLDVMLYISPTNIKRVRRFKGGDDLQQRLSKIAKKHWAIRTLKEKHQWTFLIGTNYIKWADWKKREFYPVDSREGQEIFDKANYTHEELKKKFQPRLTGLMENTCSTPDLELSERKSLKERAVSVSNAVRGRLRKFIT